MKRIFKHILAIALAAFLLSNSAAAEKNPGKITQEDLIYFILTDRFCDGDSSNNQDVRKESMNSYHGGDFQGIINKLDYIKNLGFTAIWISPVVENQPGGYHGYWATDFYKTNEHFGSMAKLKELVKAAHSKGIKVMLDLVVNHTGHLHPWVGEPKYSEWFHDYGTIVDYSNQEEVELGALAALPDLKQENPEVRKYLIDMAKWWIKETGIDGYRLDTVRHVSKDFWVDFSKEIKKDYPDFFLLGEVFDGNTGYVAGYQKTGIDGLVDFPMHFAINDVFAGSQNAGRLVEVIQNSTLYENKYLMGTFIDNHDVPRFASQASDMKEERLKQAITFMMSYTGIPVLYYGTELAMEGGADPDNRRDMDWDSQSSIQDYLKKLTDLRKSSKALTHGDLKIVKTDDEFLCFSRTFGEETIYMAANISDNEMEAEFSIEESQLYPDAVLQDLIIQETINVNGLIATLKMEPRQARLLKLEASKAFKIGTDKQSNEKKKIDTNSNSQIYQVLLAAVLLSAAAAVLFLIVKRKS